MVAVALRAEGPHSGLSLNAAGHDSTTDNMSETSSSPSGSSRLQHDNPAPQPASSHGQEHWLNGVKTATAGGIAGAFAKSCTAPLARLTILYQVQGFSVAAAGASAAAAPPAPPPGLRQAFMQVVYREGPAALWKGNLVTILHRLPYSSINFYTYERTNKLLEQHAPTATNFGRKWVSGATAGLVACSAAYPLDLVRTRLAAQTQGHYYSGIGSTLRCIVADEGLVGLYRGLGATLLQVVPSLALNFSLYDSIRNSCMALHTHMQQLRRQQRIAAETAAAAAERQDSGATTPSSSSSSSSTAHSLAVASSVDQGLSLSQMLMWHLDDARDYANSSSSSSEEAGSSSSSSRQSQEASSRSGSDAADVVAERRSHHAGASSSSSSSDTSHSFRGRDVPAGISLASGCVSGFLTATATFPLDVVRRRMQVYGRQHHGQPVSYSLIIQQVMAQGRGIRGFYVGILPEYCKVVPGVAIAFCTYEQLKKWWHVE